MADQSEITLGVGVAPTVVEHEGGRRKGRGKSRDPSRAREDLGDLERRLAKVELHLVDGEERFEEMDTRLVELDERMEELRGDMQGVLNAAFDKLASEVEQQVSLVAMAVARGGVATTSGASLVIPSRVEVPKPSVYSGARNAKEIDNFLWSLEQYFRAIGITDDAKKVDHAPLYLVDTAMVWWRRRHDDMEKGLCTIASWDEFKRELKRQFYPENAAHEARARLRRLSHRGSIRDYVKEFMETLLEIPDYPDAEALFAFTDGLQTWARMEIERRGARDLATAISIAESLVEFQRSERSRTSPQKDRSGGGDSQGKDRSSKSHQPKEVHPRSQREDRAECPEGPGERDRECGEVATLCPNPGGRTKAAGIVGHRGILSRSKKLAHLKLASNRAAKGKEQHGKRGGTPKSGSKECKEGNTPKLLKGHPLRRKVDCARGKSVTKSLHMLSSHFKASKCVFVYLAHFIALL
ncbi:hypothetical protein GH714_043951 [Hevea brasiliensis]|uniref:Retrotransposon gag domain-containing protein n=1 Tax=Hevea brasiliensis TaxID=3981 RepID=A0A6A6K266_HEVBR|nr:hypothetical protein GH714_043951 [Hevea brasiliensis]